MSLLEQSVTRKAHIVSTNANPELADKVTAYLKGAAMPRELGRFKDGEIQAQLGASVRGSYTFVFGTHGGGGMDTDKAIREQEYLVAAAQQSSASKVIAVTPYLGYSRSDRKTGREAILAREVLRKIEDAGASIIVAVDLHAPQIQGFTVSAPVENLTAAPILRNAILPRLEEGVVVVSPDAGGVKRAEGNRKRLPKELGASNAYIHKARPIEQKNIVEALGVVGDVKGRQCWITDDLVDTGNSIVAATDILMRHGAKEVLFTATHPILSDNAVERLGNSAIEHMIFTDTLALPPGQQHPKMEIVSVAPMIGDAVRAIFEDGSISSLFEGENLS